MCLWPMCSDPFAAMSCAYACFAGEGRGVFKVAALQKPRDSESPLAQIMKRAGRHRDAVRDKRVGASS